MLAALLRLLGFRREEATAPPGPPPAQAVPVIAVGEAALAASPPAQGSDLSGKGAEFPPLSAADRDILTRTLYGEARGEPEPGQIAVVHVVRNRAKARGTSAAMECQRPWQFSCWNDGDKNRPKLDALRPDGLEYKRLAAVVGRAWAMPDTVHGARHYFVAAMVPRPAWAREPGREVARIGAHAFWSGVA